MRQELATGEEVGGNTHGIKAAERIRQLVSLIKTGTLTSSDANLASAIMQDLQDALGRR